MSLKARAAFAQQQTSSKHHTVSSKCTRFGNPSQVRSQELEAQYAATTAELQELSGKHKALEARNLLLEKLVQLNKQHQQPEPTAECQDKVRSGDTLPVHYHSITGHQLSVLLLPSSICFARALSPCLESLAPVPLMPCCMHSRVIGCYRGFHVEPVHPSLNQS